MAKRSIELDNPINRQNGLIQTEISLSNVVILEDSFRITTDQGNIIDIPMNPARQAFLITLEDDAKAILDV